MDKELKINIGSKQNQQNKEKENDFKWSTCEALGSSIQILDDQKIVHKGDCMSKVREKRSTTKSVFFL